MTIKQGIALQRNDDGGWWDWSDNKSWQGVMDPAAPAQIGKWIDGTAAGMKYKVLLPDGWTPTTEFPLVCYFHQLDMGTGGAVGTLMQWLDGWFNTAAFRAKNRVIVVAPLLDQSADMSGNNVNFGGISANNTTGRDQAWACIQAVMNANKIDTRRVSITGNSMGGIAAWEFMAWKPDVFCAALILAGASYSRNPAAVATTLKTKPLWVVHGRQDGNVPLTWDRSMDAVMKQLGNVNWKYEETDEGHDVWDRVYKDSQYLNWLCTQSLGSSSGSSSGTPSTPSSPTPTPTATSAPTHGTALPLSSGFLSVRGNQYVDSTGLVQRIGSLGWNQDFGDVPTTVRTIRRLGFNCVRVSWVDASLADDLQRIDKIVAACKTEGVKLILDHHTNERGTPADGYGAQQKNGKPWDVGPGTDGTNGAGVPGTVTRSQWIANWLTVVQRYKSSDVLVGCDLHNEPLGYGLSTWGDGGTNDLHRAYTDCANAIHGVNPGLLIICEGAQDYNNTAPWGDLRPAKAKPVILNTPNKVVYSVHCYPKSISGWSPNDGGTLRAQMEVAFGFMQSSNTAPVFIGEMGARMENAEEVAWGQTLLDYMDSFKTPSQLPMSGDWWAWGQLDGQQPNGIMSNGRPRPEQQVFWSRLLFNN